MVTVVLFLFLWNFRTTFISLTAIPLSLITAILVMSYFGITINTMTLGGLAIAIGALVDDAIIDVENVFRRLKQNAHSPTPDPVVDCDFQRVERDQKLNTVCDAHHRPRFPAALQSGRLRRAHVCAARLCLHHLDYGVAHRRSDRDASALLLPAGSLKAASRRERFATRGLAETPLRAHIELDASSSVQNHRDFRRDAFGCGAALSFHGARIPAAV